jgi:hypothetical protein
MGNLAGSSSVLIENEAADCDAFDVKSLHHARIGPGKGKAMPAITCQVAIDGQE